MDAVMYISQRDALDRQVECFLLATQQSPVHGSAREFSFVFERRRHGLVVTPIERALARLGAID